MTLVMKHININAGEPKMDSLRVSDDASKEVQKTPNRVSLDSMVAKILHVEYLYPKTLPHMTIAVIIVENGFALVGKSAPADAENFDEALGRRFAYEDALRQMWPLEAYLLRQQLASPETQDQPEPEAA